MHGIDDQPAVSVDRLSARYGDFVAVKDVSFHVDAGEMVGLVGPNGAGKSTLLRSILGLQPHDGDVVVHGRAVFVPQRAEVDLDFPLSVEQLVLMGRRRFRRFWRKPSAADRQAAARALSRVGLDGLESRGLRELSGGQLQRALIARALASEASVYLLDEPLAGVDSAVAESLCDLFHVLAASGVAIVVASHDLALVKRRFERCLTMNRRLVFDGPPRDALGESAFLELFEAAHA